jgi:hypothetical protein
MIQLAGFFVSRVSSIFIRTPLHDTLESLLEAITSSGPNLQNLFTKYLLGYDDDTCAFSERYLEENFWGGDPVGLLPNLHERILRPRLKVLFCRP